MTGKKNPTLQREIYRSIVNGRRVSIFESDDHSWVRVTVPKGDHDATDVQMSKGSYNPKTGEFIEWTPPDLGDELFAALVERQFLRSVPDEGRHGLGDA